MKIRIDISRLHAANAFRGVGIYTDFLIRFLHRIPVVQTQVYIGGKKQPADVVHYPFFDLFFHTLPLIKDAKTVVTIHDVIPLVFPREYKPGIKGMMRFFLQLLSLQTVSAVVTDSECSKKDIVKYLGVSPQKVRVVHLAGNPDIRPQPPTIVRRVARAYTLPKRYVLYVGDINYNKNLPRFIDAFAGLPESYALVMVGRTLRNTSIPEGVAVQEAVRRNHLESRVHLLTNVPKDPISDLAAIFTGASLYVQPSLYEGFGLSVLDALQCGVPVVCSQVSSLPEIGGEVVRYCNPHDTENMTRVMAETLAAPWSAKDQDKRKMHAARFRWEETARKTADIYMGVAKA